MGTYIGFYKQGIVIIKIQILLFYLLLCMGVKLGLSQHKIRAFENRMLRKIFGSTSSGSNKKPEMSAH
jgi:hypothetical protein